MIGARRRQDSANSSLPSACTSTSNNTPWNDAVCSSPTNSTLLLSQRPTQKSNQRFILPLAPAAWLPISPTSPRAALRDLCLPRQEPRPPADVLNRSYLGSCSPSLAKFSRTTPSQHISTSTSTTTLPSATVHPSTFLHPTMTYLTVNGHRSYHHQQHPHFYRNIR